MTAEYDQQGYVRVWESHEEPSENPSSPGEGS